MGLAQDMLKRAVGLLDADAMIDAGAAVLTRAEKLVKAQLGLFAALRTDAGQRNRLSRIVGEALEGMPLDLARWRASWWTRRTRRSGPPRMARWARGKGAAQAVTIPPPRREPLPDLPDHTLAIVDDEALHALIRAQFEGAGDGAELLRLFAHLASRPQLQLPEALRHRAAEIIESVWDERNASPRRLLAAALLGRDDVSFRLCPLCRGQRGQAGSRGRGIAENTFTSQRYDVATGDWTIRETWTSRSGYQYLPTHAPLALLAGVFHELRASRMRGEPFIPPVAVPEQRFVWERVLAEPGAGTFARDLQVLGEGPAVLDGGGRRFHIACPGCRRRARRFTFRAQEAREQDGYDQVVQWTAWLLRSNPDTLAAHFHPMLCAAVNVINVRGLGPLLAALGASAGRRADPCTRPWRWPRRRR